ncbi:p40 [Ectropis obliqua nucleopolyhedrovirus]|uniref:Protein C42 n=1 Tax=Ectropis obliqua nucleopolyhedrovirus TaxID=59376 RepID=A0EYY3_9ABAC|nr:p40 [Ectropis obliqua nucleopolyhedrovirus]ABI35762.1 p40 [Ectropis obliqua nucleopolyhedrovirus]AGS47932.1 protein C42 [Ectropis obliqua nucleopolyhedrovirus]QWV59651.1 p40 [Ectropis obliqua nucleopolyhedrovirus]UYO72878.1 p40 [Ectropis obliqua nucleopolyhedrovirus]
MSSIDLFNEIVILRDKIDPQMQMDIWPKLFNLLPEPNDNTINLSFDEFIEFLVNVATIANNKNVDENVALASQHLLNAGADGNAGIYDTNKASTSSLRRNIFDLHNRHSIRNAASSSSALLSDNLPMLRKTCQKILQYYTLTTTSSSDFKVGDLVQCMLYLSTVPSYKPLYILLEQTFTDNNECMPNLTPDQMYNITSMLRNLLNLPNSTVDFENVKILRSGMNKIMQYPISRFPRVILLPNTNLSRDKRCTLEELILERSDAISRLEPQQYVEDCDNNKIPMCKDIDLVNDLIKLTRNFNLERMFYNAANSIFYTTMENYAINNCKFDIADYNNIYKCMDDFQLLKEKCGVGTRQPEISDSLNVYLNQSNLSTPNTLLNKRKKY